MKNIVKNIDYRQSRGFIREIILIVVGLVLIKYFLHFDLVGHAEIYLGKVIEWIKAKI